MEKKEKEIYW